MKTTIQRIEVGKEAVQGEENQDMGSKLGIAIAIVDDCGGLVRSASKQINIRGSWFIDCAQSARL